MPKYLRFIQTDVTDSDGTPIVPYPLSRCGPSVQHLTWMYEHFGTPVVSNGASKLVVNFTREDLGRAPLEVLGIATVFEPFDVGALATRPAREQQEVFLARLHGAAMRAADQFGWERGPLEAGERAIRERDFVFEFFWKKPLANPDRRWRVQAFVAASPFPTRVWLVFTDRSGTEVRRVLLSEGANCPGGIAFVLGEIGWVDATTVRVTHENGRDFWTCTTEGDLTFHYPRGEREDPHGEYDLGRMYLEGMHVLRDEARGLALIGRSAAKGFRHAVRFLESRGRREGAGPGA